MRNLCILALLLSVLYSCEYKNDAQVARDLMAIDHPASKGTILVIYRIDSVRPSVYAYTCTNLKDTSTITFTGGDEQALMVGDTVIMEEK